MELAEKHLHLQETIARYQTVAVAFSGGVDSTLLLKVASDILGKDKVLALTVSSPLYPDFETAESQALARQIGVRQLLVTKDPLADPEVAANQPLRCYHCKKALYQQLQQLAAEHGYETVLDGSNLDDLDDYRPGQEALKELQIASPLLETGFSKAEVRALSRQLQLPSWNKQAFACLASRIPYGTSLTRERLQQVDRCESWLREQGFTNYRVRYHHELARIELPETELPRLLEAGLRQKLVTSFKAAGFTYVSLDLQGYRTGSMNETLLEQHEKTD